jgi:glycine C-acetyltransferase
MKNISEIDNMLLNDALNDKGATSLADYYDVPNCDIFERANKFQEYTCHLKSQGHYNYRRISTTGSGPTMLVLDSDTGFTHEMIYLASNDYLNLTKHPRVIAAGVAATEKYGAGAGSVPLLGGTLNIHCELENKIAKFKGCEDAIVYTSGFDSNCSTILSLLGKSDLAILDTLVHASIVDGCANTTNLFFRHGVRFPPAIWYLQRQIQR